MESQGVRQLHPRWADAVVASLLAEEPIGEGLRLPWVEVEQEVVEAILDLGLFGDLIVHFQPLYSSIA